MEKFNELTGPDDMPAKQEDLKQSLMATGRFTEGNLFRCSIRCLERGGYGTGLGLWRKA